MLIKRLAKRIAPSIFGTTKAQPEGHDPAAVMSRLSAELELVRYDRDAKESERVALLEKINEADLRLTRFGQEEPFVPNGHFYSPVPMRDDAERHSAMIFSDVPGDIPGIDMRAEAQLEMFSVIVSLCNDLPFRPEKLEGFRYHYENSAFSYGDAIFLNGIMRAVQPRRIVEVGSGYSSAMMLDTSERWLGSSIDFTFIEPYPDLLKSLLKEGDAKSIRILGSRVQDVEADVFSELTRGDILFVDSTHISKIGSDVNHIVFNVLPTLNSGVLVHFHDIVYPFEYPEEWVKSGIAWNEAYLLRAFLMNNSEFEVVVHNNYIWQFHRNKLAESLPLCMKNPGAGLWIRKK